MSLSTTNDLATLGLGEMFDDRILGTDSAHVFMVSAQAIAARSGLIAEVGCGRGALVDLRAPGGAWQDLRGDGRTVIGIDIETVGAENPIIDEFRLIGEDGVWPLDDGSVDLAVSDFVLEHVTDPVAFVSQLAPRAASWRSVHRPHHQPQLAAGPCRSDGTQSLAMPRVLEHLQPGREERDVFETAYRMNSRQDLQALLAPEFDWALARRTGLEQYCKPWPTLRRAVGPVERVLPTSLWMALVVFARRR